MNKKLLSCFAVFVGTVLFSASNGFSLSTFKDAVDEACAPQANYTPVSCSSCHNSAQAQDAYLAGGTALTDFFCPPTTPTCTDNDNDSYAVEGGDCGPVDCDDTNNAINPGAQENCSDSVDNNCNGLIDDLDPAAVGCLVCTDNDGDTFASNGGDCGAVDCNDNDIAINPNAVDIPNNGIDENCSGSDSVDPTLFDNDGDGYTQTDDCDDTNPNINPVAQDIPNNGIDENCDGFDSLDTTLLDNDGDGFTQAAGDCDDTDGDINPNAIEICTDGVDNDCNGFVDVQDSNAVDCPVTCVDLDADTYAIDGGECGPVDCNDSNATINPGSEEICGDSLDNDCDGEIDENCDFTCPDLDGDGFQDAACGGMDCNDNDANVNPGAAEVCGNGFDENCNGASDDTCLTCPDGTLLVIKEMEYNRGDEKLAIKGRATVGTSISIINSDTNEILAEGISVNKGKWKAKIKNVDRSLENITVLTSNGCAVDREVTGDVDRDRDGDRDDDRDDDRDRGRDHDRDDDRNWSHKQSRR